MSTILKTIHAILAESKIALGAKSKKGDLQIAHIVLQAFSLPLYTKTKSHNMFASRNECWKKSKRTPVSFETDSQENV